jgi:tetratricopeptide (TPR) repeat protein
VHELAAIRPAGALRLLEQRDRGLFHHAMAQPEATLAHLIPVYRADPADDTVALAVAEASLWKKDPATAQLVLGQLQAPDAPQALRVRGLMLEQSLRFAEALELYDRAIPQLDQPWGTLERKAQVLSWQKRFDASSATYAIVAGAHQASRELRQRCRLRLAEVRAWKKDFGGALAELGALLKDAPELVEAWLLTGQILEWQGELTRAKQAYSRVLTLDSQHVEARSRLDGLLWVD